MPQTLPNPLHDVHRQAQAEFQNWADLEIVQTFGEPQAEYAAICKSAGLIDLPQRGILELTGKDRLPLLNNLLTNQTWDKANKTGLLVGQGVYAFMLNLRGRIVVDVNVLERGDRTLLEMDSRFVEPLRAILDKFLFSEQVTLTSRLGQLNELAIYGPAAERVLGPSIAMPLQSVQTTLFDADSVVWRDDATGVPGFNLIIPADAARAVWMNLLARFGNTSGAGRRMLRPIGWAAFNAARIEGGRPILGIDFDAAPIASAAPGRKDPSLDDPAVGTLPAETGLLDRAVSFTKGCYLGQEIVARMHARHQVARQVVGIRMESGALPIAGAQVLDDQSKPIGVVTSSTVSPVLSNATIAIAMIKRPHFTVGAKLRVPAEGAIHPASVIQLPFIPPLAAPASWGSNGQA
jgi:folate-binding protein YgfZ